jgi:predicted naringenin-chalcone synthase
MSEARLAPAVRPRRGDRHARHLPEPRREPARLAGLALSTPAGSFSQDEVLALLGLSGDPFASGIFARCGVRSRHLELTPGLLASTLQQRTAGTEEQLFRLATQAVDELALDPAQIGVVVTATYYSLGGPALSHRVVDHYGLDPATDKYHLVGVGCASAVPLFRLAASCLRDRPERFALVVAAESITGFLTSVGPGDSKTKVVGSALFGDGCAAALLEQGGQGDGPDLLAHAVSQVPGTLDRVRFAVTAADSHMQLSRELPALTETAARPLVESFLSDQGLGLADVDHWLVHPGGRGIVEALQRGLDLSDEQVAPSLAVLAEYGNVGTPAGLFVLHRALESRDPRPGDYGLMVSVGPGVTIGLMLLRWPTATSHATEEVVPCR